MKRSPYIQFLTPSGTIGTLTYGHMYNHVGSSFSMNSAVFLNVVAKLRKNEVKGSSHIQRVLRRPDRSMNIRFCIYWTFLLAKRFVSVGTWPCLRKGEMAHVHARVLRAYRTMVGEIASQTHRTDADFPAITSLPSPWQILVAERLSLLCRILVSGTEQLLLALNAANNHGRVKGQRNWLDGVEEQLDSLISSREQLRDKENRRFNDVDKALPRTPSDSIICFGIFA